MDVTEVKSGPAFQKTEHSRLVAVMRRNKEKAADYARRHGVPRCYHIADDLINDPEINAIYIATPPDTHAGYAIQAMRAGKPVYVEKPMALDYAECREMIKVSKETKMPLFVAYYRRKWPAADTFLTWPHINLIFSTFFLARLPKFMALRLTKQAYTKLKIP